MAAKQILYKEAGRRKLLSGMKKAFDAVKVTLGPKARHVVLDKGFGAPEISDDGVSIVKEIELKDKVENLGVEILKEVAEKTSDKGRRRNYYRDGFDFCDCLGGSKKCCSRGPSFGNKEGDFKKD
jgi:hypothetical protein